VHRRQPCIAGRDAVATLHLQGGEKAAKSICIDVGNIKALDGPAGPSHCKSQEKYHRVAVASEYRWKVAQLRQMAAPLHISADCTSSKDQQVGAAEGAQQPGMAAIAALQRKLLEQPRHALVED
jgi:hypothetical protein